MFDEQPDGNPHGECAEEIARLRAELAKVTWQRNEARADLAASQAECERLSSMIDHQRDEAMEMERMLRAELADSQSECERMTELCRRLYGNLGDVKWCATEDGSQGKGTGRHIACFVLTPNAKGQGSAACGASAAPTGCASNGSEKEE